MHEQHKRGVRSYQAGAFEEASQLFAESLKLRETSEGWNDWGVSRVACCKHAEAERAFRRALELDPSNLSATQNLGTLLAFEGRTVEALPVLEQAEARAEGEERADISQLAEMCRGMNRVGTPAGRGGAGQEGTPGHLGGHCGVTHLDPGALGYLIRNFGVRSMVDIGCGPGGMVLLGRAMGLRALGVDGDPQTRALSGLGPTDLLIHDFTVGKLNCPEEFDLGWSIEFLEHVEERYQPNYMEFVGRCRMVFCTAAPPGKGGIHHVNCRDRDYWCEVFRRWGFRFDGETTEAVRGASTMLREFVRTTGMFFQREA